MRYRNLLTRGSTVAMGLVLAFGFAAGIVFWGGFNTALEMTNTESFCIILPEHRLQSLLLVTHQRNA